MAFSKIYDTITKYPRLSFFVSLVVATPMGNYALKKRARSELLRPIDKLEMGTRPFVPLKTRESMIPRQDISTRIHDMYFPNKLFQDGHFGVILGPSGSGKTVAVMDLCEKHPEGVRGIVCWK